jgi:hypothetical protein
VKSLKNRTFWSILSGVNATSILFCAAMGSSEGVLFSGIGFLSSTYILLFICEK